MQHKVLPTPPPSLLRYDTLFNEDGDNTTQTSFQSSWMDEDFSILCTPNDNRSLISKEVLTKEKAGQITNLQQDSDRLASNSLSALLSLFIMLGLVSYLCC